MAIVNFPDQIEVVLGSHFNAASFYNLSEDDVLVLTKGTGSHKIALDPNVFYSAGYYSLNYTLAGPISVTYWSEDGSLTPSPSNRLIFIPRGTEQSFYLSAGIYVCGPNYVDLDYDRMERAHVQGAKTPNGTVWNDPIIAHRKGGPPQGDYSFKELFSETVTVSAETNVNLTFNMYMPGFGVLLFFPDASGSEWLYQTVGSPGTIYEPGPAYVTFQRDVIGETPYNPNIFKSMGIPVSVVADFTSDVTSGDADLTVQFTDTSTGGPTSWLWDFGDGDTSTDQNPEHIYDTAGIYTVSLTIDGGADTKTVEDYTTVFIKSEFSATPLSGRKVLTVQFTDESKGVPTSWLWDFGDGTTSTEQNPEHAYVDSGKYTVLLRAMRVEGS